MTLEDLADLIRANSANTNGRIDSVDAGIEALRNEANAALMNAQNDLTDARAEIGVLRNGLTGLRSDVAEARIEIAEMGTEVAEVRRNLDLTPVLSLMQRQIDTLAAEVAELKRRAS